MRCSYGKKLYLLHHYKERGLPWDTSIFTLTVEKKLCHSLVSTLTQSKKLWRKRSKINKELQDRILPSWITDPNQGHYYLQDCYPLQFIDTDEVKANIKKNEGQWELFTYYLENKGKLRK